MMKTICYVMVGVLLLLASCTKDNFINTGVSNGRFDGNILEYMSAHSYDWDSTLVMIYHAGVDMVKLFEGNDEEHSVITFFGLTNHSIRRYLLEQGFKQVSDLDAEWCRSILLQHVVDGKIYRKDIPEGYPGDYGLAGTGGCYVTTLAGNQLWVYVDIQENGAIVENAARPIFVNFIKTGLTFEVASGDIEPDDAVIHALQYDFTLGDEE
ncbi:fasciclin domain-containing protein [Butyricimonas paravirosa]|uniref:fasciclin domain-containing protein n=1 Tax=Butyricimonas paravirosa TaxID=1472417 RepID=UPI0022E40CB4|nr:fasciclin domain-containing protein [Butyricimonas paravirosa]